MKTAGDEDTQVEYLYLLVLRSHVCDNLFLFYARDEQHAQRQAIACQQEQDDFAGSILQRVAFRRCPQGFTAGMHTFWPPTRPVASPHAEKTEKREEEQS